MRPNRSGSHDTSNGSEKSLMMVLPFDETTAVAPVAVHRVSGRRANSVHGVGGIHRHGGKKTGTCLPHLRAGRHEILEVLRDVLVIDVQLIFERVELGFVEHLPPFPFSTASCGCAGCHVPGGAAL